MLLAKSGGFFISFLSNFNFFFYFFSFNVACKRGQIKYHFSGPRLVIDDFSSDEWITHTYCDKVGKRLYVACDNHLMVLFMSSSSSSSSSHIVFFLFNHIYIFIEIFFKKDIRLYQWEKIGGITRSS